MGLGREGSLLENESRKVFSVPSFSNPRSTYRADWLADCWVVQIFESLCDVISQNPMTSFATKWSHRQTSQVPVACFSDEVAHIYRGLRDIHCLLHARIVWVVLIRTLQTTPVQRSPAFVAGKCRHPHATGSKTKRKKIRSTQSVSSHCYRVFRKVSLSFSERSCGPNVAGVTQTEMHSSATSQLTRHQGTNAATIANIAGLRDRTSIMVGSTIGAAGGRTIDGAKRESPRFPIPRPWA